jgi:hypothetical protein
MDAADALLPLIVSMTRTFQGASVDMTVDRLVATAPSVPRADIRRLVTVAVAAEQLLASSLQQLVGAALLADPSDRSAYTLVALELTKILSRPS